MIQKLIRVVLSFAMLVGAYLGYVRAFALVADRLTQGLPGPIRKEFVVTRSKTAIEASRLAEESFGKGHWTTRHDLKIKLYDADRGYYMYAQNYKPLKDGKKFEFWPFAVIWHAKDGKSRKTAVSRSAEVDLSEPLSFISPGAKPIHIVHARLIDDVRLRDDRGTLDTQADDVYIEPLPYIEFDDPSLSIVSRSRIVLHDRDLTFEGDDLDLRLRRRSGSTVGFGFEPETLVLARNARVAIKNVGKSGVLPGEAKGTKSGEATPLVVTCDDELRINFPVKVKPFPAKILAGPPRLEGPTVATFQRNVQVVRGVVLPDRLTADTLRLTFLPDATAKVTPSGRAEGPLLELTLREANAVGHAVWLYSEAQSVKARCNELIYKKLGPYQPDETYLRGDATKPLYVEKRETVEGSGKNKERFEELTTIWAVDAKIFDDGRGGPANAVVARGPGRLETRTTTDKAVARSASWQDILILKADPAEPPKTATVLADAPKWTRRRITATGMPKFEDHARRLKLEAEQSLVVSLVPEPPGQADEKKGDEKKTVTKIDWLQAKQNAKVTAPGKTLSARDELNLVFDQEAAIPVRAAAAPTLVATAKPTVAGPNPAEKPKQAERSPEPPVTVSAKRVWAKLKQGETEEESELLEARLRGDVVVHQDPAPDRKRGTDAKGQALDLIGRGKGKVFVKVFGDDPSADAGRAKLASLGGAGQAKPATTIAEVDTEEYSIRGSVIGFDQATDDAWVDGAGSFVQQADRGLLLERKSEAEANASVKAKASSTKNASTKRTPTFLGTLSGDSGRKTPMRVTWDREMKLRGRSRDLQNRAAGKIEFRGKVSAKMETGAILAEELDLYTDRYISLARPDNSKAGLGISNAEDVPPEPKPELSYVDARGLPRDPANPASKGTDVVIVSAKFDATTKELIEQQRVEGEHVIYDKLNGEYSLPAPGLARIWRRKKLEESREDPKTLAREPRVIPTARLVEEDASKPAKPKYGAWELTKIQFEEEMKGRLGSAEDESRIVPRVADFRGAVRSVNAIVGDRPYDIEFDRPPTDMKYLTSDALRVVEIPSISRDEESKPTSRYFLTAAGRALGRTRTHAIDGDRITFDSLTELFYVYGDDAKGVVVQNQSNPGQPYSNARGKAAKYNHKTGEAELIEPSTISVFEAKTGLRLQPEAPRPSAPKQPDTGVRRPDIMKGSPRPKKEQGGFNGR